MKTLALRIYLAVVAVLLVFAMIAAWVAQRHMESERTQMQSQATWSARAVAWGELIENSLPPSTANEQEQAQVFLDWAERLRVPMALDNPNGLRIATAPMLADLLQQRPDLYDRLQSAKLSDGRVLWVIRPGALRGARVNIRILGGPPGLDGPPDGRGFGGPPPDLPWFVPLGGVLPHWLIHGLPALLTSLVVLFVAVALGAWPIAIRLTRRLQALRDGVEAFGSGQLAHRVAVEGKDEVAEVAQSFNQAAQRIEELVTANRSLLANASHELRSPLARLKMAVSMLSELPPERAAQLKKEIHQDIRELDALVEELLLASRLETKNEIERVQVDLIGLMAEEAGRTQANLDLSLSGGLQHYPGDERLLRRAVRNLLENARRYGGPDTELTLESRPMAVDLVVADRGPGVPEDQRERIFEPFYRMPGHAEHAGGVGLGLSLVRQIARQHDGSVRCEPRDGGGSRFIISLPR